MRNEQIQDCVAKTFWENILYVYSNTSVLGHEFGINCGVLGPILFMMYINSIGDSKLDVSMITYADDTFVYYMLWYIMGICLY